MLFRRSVLEELGGFDEALDTGAPLPGGGDLVTISVAGTGAALVDRGRVNLGAGKKGTALQFHLIGFDQAGDYQISLAGSRNLCLEQGAGHVQLNTCGDRPVQRFVLEPAGSGAFYVHGTGGAAGSYLYQGVGDIASFDVVAEVEPDHWVFTEKGFEPID